MTLTCPERSRRACPQHSRRTMIDRLIINSPYTEPSRHWRYEREMRDFSRAEGRHIAVKIVDDRGSESLKVVEVAR